jgi:stage II sporulation protein R
MFRRIILPLLAVLLSLGLTAVLAGAHPTPASSTPSVHFNDPAPRLPSVLRFRVIANSDTAYDEAVKIAVRNLILGDLEPVLGHVHSVSAAQAVIARELPTLRGQVAALLRQDGVSYQAALFLGVTAFPTKAYGTWVLPAGRYPALVVRLGLGEGHNWWCVLFPSLCFIDTDSGLAIPVAKASPDIAPATKPPSPPRVVWWIPWRAWFQGL